MNNRWLALATSDLDSWWKDKKRRQDFELVGRRELAFVCFNKQPVKY